MTEKNADVEWLRGVLSMMAPRPDQRVSLSRKQAESILAHIDQLEADIREARNEWESACERAEGAKAVLYDRRPTVHEIAADLYARWVATHEMTVNDFQACAKCCYDAAVALVAEGRRRDGL